VSLRIKSGGKSIDKSEVRVGSADFPCGKEEADYRPRKKFPFSDTTQHE
jgi:hypothetical protein